MAHYYPEHWDESQWQRDIRKMAELGLEVIHMGEFAWARFELEEGRYDFEWLDTAVGLAEQHGLKIILCTTTATPPAWLSTKHPEILRVDENGNRLAQTAVSSTYILAYVAFFFIFQILVHGASQTILTYLRTRFTGE